MEEKQMLELILSEIREMKSTQTVLVQKVSSIELTLEIHTQKIDAITEQLVKVSELEPLVLEIVEDTNKLKDDIFLVKRVMRN